MDRQEQRRTSNANKYHPLANRGRRILFPTTTTAPAIRIWLLPGRLPLLMLFSALQTPTGSSEVAMNISFDLAPNSFDDQYQGCSQQVMEKLNQGDYFTRELETHRNYFRVWNNAHLTWLNLAKALPKNINMTHAMAILIYTSNNSIRTDFIRAMASAARTPQQYKHSFRFKYLHYYLTSAIQLLRKETVGKNNSLCYEVHHEMKGINLEAYTGATIRFGQFLSTSLLKEDAQKSEKQTLFTIRTCLGAPVEEVSLKKEVLVPPYELFKVVNMSYHPRGNWLRLQSAGNRSTYNCQLLKASSKKYNPAPMVIASLSFLTSVVISSKSRV